MLVGQETLWFLLVLLLSITKSTNNFSSYLEVLRIPCTSKEKLLMDNSSTQKKRCLLTVFRFLYIYKKSGTALLLFRYTGSGIAFHLNKQHRSPRRYVRTRTPICFRCTEIDIHIPRTSKCCNVLGDLEFTRFV